MPKRKQIVVFTDGSCEGNGKSGAVGGIGIHFPNKELKDISKPFTREKCTNQTTELYAILVAIRYIKQKIGLDKVNIHIKSDSSYSINACTKWTPGWIKNGWKTTAGKPVSNKEFIYPIFKYQQKYPITFEHVEGHAEGDDEDAVGNNQADNLARKGTRIRRSQIQKGENEKTSATKKTPKYSSKTSATKKTKRSSKGSIPNDSPPPQNSFYEKGVLTVIELVKEKR
jgi:ribonuclease HI